MSDEKEIDLPCGCAVVRESRPVVRYTAWCNKHFGKRDGLRILSPENQAIVDATHPDPRERGEETFEEWYERIRRERGGAAGPLDAMDADATQMLLAAYYDRAPAPSEAVAWQLVHTRTGQRWTPSTDRASVENQQREFAALGATETRIAALVDHHPAPARGVTVTEAMVERAMGVECGSTHHEHHPPDCRRCWQAKLTAALTPDTEGDA